MAKRGRVVVIEYEVSRDHPATGVKYNNRLVNLTRSRTEKIAQWRDYMD